MDQVLHALVAQPEGGGGSGSGGSGGGGQQQPQGCQQMSGMLIPIETPQDSRDGTGDRTAGGRHPMSGGSVGSSRRAAGGGVCAVVQWLWRRKGSRTC